MGGDFSWTLDPDIAATMLLAAIVVGLVATTKENYEEFFQAKIPRGLSVSRAVKFELFKYITE